MMDLSYWAVWQGRAGQGITDTGGYISRRLYNETIHTDMFNAFSGIGWDEMAAGME